ncbi:MAG: glucose 1-dehydrogenase [Alphaproteobacteria bacterium]|nr:glucose 1-dehydrogenase [Alphaproteobacteria bacterium]MCY4497272.1 glucose 1-dehydrogenase [Rhodospirillaceae bacterium]
MNRVDGKVAIVTGAGKGIGRATAELLAECGAKVLVTDVLDAEVEETVEQIRAQGGEAQGLRHDVTNEDDWTAAVDAAVNGLGGFEVLINNAGVYLQKSIEDTTFEEYDRVMRINVWGVMLGTRFAMSSMKERISADDPAGAIVNLVSTASIKGSPFASVYATSKGAVRLFTRSTAREISALGYNIRVNGIYPGIIDTEMGAAAMQRIVKSVGESENRAREIAEELHLINRLGTAVDIARGIVFLASEDASYITGTEFVVDGGFWLK